MSSIRPLPGRRPALAPLAAAVSLTCAVPLATLVALAALATTAAPLTAQSPPTLRPADYGQWESLGAYDLDPTGRWLVTAVRRVDDHDELRLLRTDGTGEPLVLAHSSAPAFSADGRWLAYLEGVSQEERERLAEADEPIRTRLGVVDLATGAPVVSVPARRFAFRDDGAWLAAHGYGAADSVGADLLVMRPDGTGRTLLGNVGSFAWQEDGPLLALTVQTATEGADGVTLFDADAGTLRSLVTGSADFRALTWRAGSAQLGVLRSMKADGWAEESHDVLVWEDVRTGRAPRVLAGTAVQADSLRISDAGGLRFDDAGTAVFLGVRPWEADEEGVPADSAAPGGDETEVDAPPADSAAADGADDEDEIGPADVQVWHWNDDDILRAQEYGATRAARLTHLAVWWLEGDEVVVLGDDFDEPVRVLGDGPWGLVADGDPYAFERRFGDGSADLYRVDLRTGERALLARAAEHGLSTSPDGRTGLLFQDGAWHVVDLTTLARRPVGGPDAPNFERPLEDYDYPGARPSWGVGGWYADGRAALLYDAHDVWRVDLGTGALTRLTPGAQEGARIRVVTPDPDAVEDGLPTDEPLWLSMFWPRTKQSGYGRLAPGRGFEPLVAEEAAVGGLRKAADADVYVLRQERWDDAPDLFVSADGGRDWRQLTTLNPFQGDFAWGRSELLDYTTDAGHDLQAMLIYPADFEEGQTYPLILYQYERLSDNLHRYRVPSRTDYYNPQVWSQEGYFVLMPDILYEPGRPGPSALDAVEHALDAAVATGHVDAARMGLIGHSWGGYQAAYLPTRTNRFAASVAGAAITDFTSFMGAVHWNGGLPETGHWETGQARMAVPYWEDVAGHLESSPVHFIHELATPVLLMHGDADGVVDFRQGLEYYNFARRAGKEVVLLVYPGADHGLTKEEHQADYQRRILEWFNHHLRGAPPARWITEGESWDERAERIGR